MLTIRGRLTAAWAIALGSTLLVFAVVVLGSTLDSVRAGQRRNIEARLEAVATLGSRIIEQSGVNLFESVVVGEDSLAPSLRLSGGVRRLLAVLPGYVVVADSQRVLFLSGAAGLLTPRDLNALSQTAMRRFSPTTRAGQVRLDSAVLILVSHFEQPSIARVNSLRVVVGEEIVPASLTDLNLLRVVVIAFPLILLLSVGAAWVVIGNTLAPIERLIGDLEAIQDGRSLHRRLPVESDENELDRLAATINAMIARLEGSFAALRRFTADASHELKTPLTVLRADLERAMQSPQVTHEQLAPLEEALSETARMADLVDSLLTLARADEGRFDLHRETVALGPIVTDVHETAHILGEAAGVAIELVEYVPTTVSGDPIRLRQLFLNLVTNAIKYTARGGKVTIALERRGAIAAFVVQDSGLGIAAADLPFIFDRFWRADRARSRGGERGGFGLGLAISQWIAHAHGGSITVASRLGRGSTFTVTIPAIDGA